MVVYILLGLFKNDRFSYARTAVVPEAQFSIVSNKVAEDLKCIEKLDKPLKAEFPNIGLIEIESLCSVDRVVIDGMRIDMKTVFHIVPHTILKSYGCEAAIGRDVIMWWRLEYDVLTGRYRSRLAKPVELYR